MKPRSVFRFVLAFLLIGSSLITAAATAAPVERLKGTGSASSTLLDLSPQVVAEAAGSIGSLPTVRINEVMPRPAGSGRDWVELYQPRAAHTRFLPVTPNRAAGTSAASQLDAPAGPRPAASIAGWHVCNKAGACYAIPVALPAVPAGAFVLIYFDGLGAASNDYDFTDGVAVLHTPAGLVDIFDAQADVVALYTGAVHNAQTVRDFVAYGGPPGAADDHAAAAGLWPADQWASLALGSGAEAAGDLTPSRSLGLYPGHSNRGPDDWAVYQGADLTPGSANPLPRAQWATTGDGAVFGSDGFALGWPWVPAARYQLQMDDDPAFGSLAVNAFLDAPYYAPQPPPPPGVYWWRVRAIVGEQAAAWSAPARVTIIPVVEASAAARTPDALTAVDQTILAMTWLRQRKDTRLLCLDGDNEGNPASNASEEAWDAVHPDAIYTHGRNNCVRASIAMIVTHYGGNLSQDRLSYRLFENWGAPIENIGQLNNPHLDLGHDRTTLVCGGDGSNGGRLLAWALGINVADYTYAYAKPTFAQVRGWIDASRPVMRFHGGHQTVIGGYRTLGDGTQQVRLFDPWSATTWENYNTLNITCYYVPPASAPGVRSDEPGIWTDADGDGIMDWDEQFRFFTSAVSPDSDMDWVQDKQDLREYVFTNAGAYNLRNADVDGDGLRKERDPDNDGDGSVDGCEDTNFNGKYESALGETDNLSAASHQPCTPRFDILQPTQTTPVNAGAYNGPDKILVQVKTATPPSSPVTYAAADFSVKVGAATATVLSAYRVFDTHFLVVSAPAQAAADYYDLEVKLGSQTDKETRAVYYLPRLRADQVLVIDRSGSMSDYGKMDAAKNAARAFIDHTGIGDMIGVVSFSASASTNYGLTTITGDPEWNAAKSAVNALTPATSTALGQGARRGYDELAAKGKNDHDWAMALLSDGMENVTPYWSDPTVSGVIVPSRVAVHTVALGYDADVSLMAAIAGQTGGTAYEAGTDILPLAAAASRTSFTAASGSPQAGATGGAALPGPNVPSTLPNRLADIYKAIGEEVGHQQRLFEKTGTFSGRETFEVPVEEGLPEGIFAVNWDDPGSPITFNLFDPNGNQVKPGGGVIFQSDLTHQQYRVKTPMPGVWVVDLRTREKQANYLFMLSAWSPTTMHLAFGLPPEQRVSGAQIPILAILADYKAITGAEVWARVQGPNSDLVQTLQLFDDGAHQDGRANDGVYGNLFTRAYWAGQYLVKATGWGVNNFGESFIRHKTGGFTILPRVAYVWLDDLPTAYAYRSLLQAEGFTVDLIALADVAKTLWGFYSLIVIGPDTGDGATWGDSAAVNSIAQSGRPVIGLGEGGYAFFGRLGLAIGYPRGWHGDENRAYVVDTAHPVWSSPYNIPIPRDRIVTVYKRTAHVGIEVVRPTADMVLVGREPGDQRHYDLLQQSRYFLWGFQAGPSAMTEEGQHLFINLAQHMIGM